jgi:hypothetical protein
MYDYKPGESACRISGTLAVKRVTGAFYQMALFFFGLILGCKPTCTSRLLDTDTLAIHMSTITVGYLDYLESSYSPGIVELNLSHIITEFSFGPHFPDIVQPLDNSFEATDKS